MGKKSPSPQYVRELAGSKEFSSGACFNLCPRILRMLRCPNTLRYIVRSRPYLQVVPYMLQKQIIKAYA